VNYLSACQDSTLSSHYQYSRGSPNIQAHNNNTALGSVVKDELDDGDLFQDSDSDDGEAYMPRP
jgi:hypothetical protein